MSLYQTAGDAGGGRTLAWRNDDSHPVVTASSHGAASCIHHKANQKPVAGRPEAGQGETSTIFTAAFEMKCSKFQVTDDVATMSFL